ncbi:MAG: endonuclease/exonuclease/phosphatase family protein [Gemmatimonadales bacterium]
MTTSGVVTAAGSDGFYLQDPEGDGDEATSDAIFVATGALGSVAAGDRIRVTGRVTEFVPGGTATGNLSLTRIGAPNFTVLSRNSALPEPVVIGSGGRVPPAELVIGPAEQPVDLRLQTQAAANRFNPDTDALDFFEALEGMRVTIQDPVAISATRTFTGGAAEVFALPDRGRHIVPPSRRTERGGLYLRSGPHNRGNQNPGRMKIYFDRRLFPAPVPPIAVGARLGDVTGVVSYGFGNFEVRATASFEVAPTRLPRERTSLAGTGDQLSVASYNVLNLSAQPEDDAQRRALAEQIMENLKTPDIVALQEIQDNSGEADDGTTDAGGTLRALAEAVLAAGGPEYSFFDVAPADGRAGGAPGGNIRNAFLYRPGRVRLLSFAALTPGALAAAGARASRAFAGARDPLMGSFEFSGATVVVINNHLSSRYGSTPVFGAVHPFVQAGEADREAQTGALHDYVASLLQADADARVLVLGDMNTYEFTDDLTRILPGAPAILSNLLAAAEETDRYSYNFEGNSLALDHVFVTRSLLQGAALDIVHLNVDFPETPGPLASDHDPLVARVQVGPRVNVR